MARTKYKRIEAAKELKNVFNTRIHDIRQSLNDFFNTSGKFTLEIGCGSGEYSVELALRFPERYFIGIDVKAARIYNGALKAINLKLDNVAFVVARAQNLNEIFPDYSIEEIYIPFPDPHIRRANHNRRLISTDFLKIYKKLLIPDGRIHFKTDNEELYDYALKTISEFGCKIIVNSRNLYENSSENISSDIKTSFEQHYVKQGRAIRYICFQF